MLLGKGKFVGTYIVSSLHYRTLKKYFPWFSWRKKGKVPFEVLKIVNVSYYNLKALGRERTQKHSFVAFLKKESGAPPKNIGIFPNLFLWCSFGIFQLWFCGCYRQEENAKFQWKFSCCCGGPFTCWNRYITIFHCIQLEWKCFESAIEVWKRGRGSIPERLSYGLFRNLKIGFWGEVGVLVPAPNLGTEEEDSHLGRGRNIGREFNSSVSWSRI